jgi:hypothetical protein
MEMRKAPLKVSGVARSALPIRDGNASMSLDPFSEPTTSELIDLKNLIVELRHHLRIVERLAGSRKPADVARVHRALGQIATTSSSVVELVRTGVSDA